MRVTPHLRTAAAQAINRPLSLGFIGLGAMGEHMAAHVYWKTLLAHGKDAPESAPELFVCDAHEAAAVNFKSEFEKQYGNSRVTLATTPAQVAQQCQVLFTVLPSSPEVKTVYLGSEGILSGLSATRASGTLCVDCTTLDVDVAREVANEVQKAGADMVDAPMSGGIVGAKAGTLSFMVGGEAKAFFQAEPYLMKMGSRVVHCGPSGMGLAAKISNNLILGINQIALAEGMLLGTSLGLDPSLLTFIINASTGRSWPSEVNNPVPGALAPPASPPCDRDYEGGFASKLMLKDMNLALHAAKQSGVPLPLGSNATNEYSEVVEDKALAQKDFSVVYEHLRRKMGGASGGAPSAA